MLYPYVLIREKWNNTWKREMVEGLVLVGKDFGVARRGILGTGAFITCHEYLPNKELYDTKRMVHITEEGPKRYL